MILWFFPILFMMGCAAPVHVSASYEVLISPDFSPEQTAQIDLAMQEWVDQSGVTLTITHEPCPDVPVAHRICVLPILSKDYRGPQEHVWGSTVMQDGFATIFLLTDLITPGRYTQIAAHEMGHAMGLPHGMTGSVMCATMTWGPGEGGCAAEGVTVFDALALDNGQN